MLKPFNNHLEYHSFKNSLKGKLKGHFQVHFALPLTKIHSNTSMPT